MKPKEKANDLVGRIFEAQHVDDRAKMICLSTVNIAIIAVEEIVKALTEYGSESMELQNMDSEFRFWEEVFTELKAMK